MFKKNKKAYTISPFVCFYSCLTYTGAKYTHAQTGSKHMH